MKTEESDQVIESFLESCEEICAVSKTAQKNRKSLSGSNFYGDKFHNLLIKLSRAEIEIRKLIAASGLEQKDSEKFAFYADTIKSPTTTSAKRAEAVKQLRLFCKSELSPLLKSLTANPVPSSEQVLPMDVVRGTRKYIEKIVLEANGCYEHQWYDACAVMIRRVVETLIIEVYEASGKEANIKDKDNHYFMLGGLVDKITADQSWNLGRETKAALPLLKSLGDRSAHNRRYLARKMDIDNILPGLRVVADDLIHLAYPK
jgi:hypothetical protein